IVLDWPLHWSVKFVGIVAGTVSILLLTYHLFVRNTIIGQVLNGRRRRSDTVTIETPVGLGDASKTRSVVAELRDVRKQCDSTIALGGVDLQIRRGEVF